MSRIIENQAAPQTPNKPNVITDNGDGILDDDDLVAIADSSGVQATMKVSTYLGIEPSPDAVRLITDIGQKQGLDCRRFAERHPLKNN